MDKLYSIQNKVSWLTLESKLFELRGMEIYVEYEWKVWDNLALFWVFHKIKFVCILLGLYKIYPQLL